MDRVVFENVGIKDVQANHTIIFAHAVNQYVLR